MKIVSASPSPEIQPAAASPRSTKKWRTLLILVCVLLVIAALLPSVKSYLQSVVILVECNGTLPPRILQSVCDRNVISERVSIPGPGGDPIAAMLYTPASNPNAPGMVIVHGLDPGGMNALSGYGRLEASCGLRVLTPDITQLKTYSVANIDQSEINIIGASTQWLARRTGHPVSLMGISFSGGLALVTAAKKEYAPSIKLVFDVGGYDDLARVIHFYITGIEKDPDGKSTEVQRGPWDSYFLEYTDLAMTGSPVDISALSPILIARIINAAHHPKSGAQKISDLTTRLTPQQAHKLDLLDRKVQGADYAKLVANTTVECRQVSPHGNLEGIAAPVYILHGLNDDTIPSEEALWLEKDLAPSGRVRRVLITPLVTHVSITKTGKKITQRDKLSLVYFFYKLHNAETSPYAGRTDKKQLFSWFSFLRPL